MMLAAMQEVTRIERIADEWRDLAVASGGGIFATPDWAEAWWRTRGKGAELALWCARGTDGRLTTVLPLDRRSVAGLVVGRVLGHGPADDRRFQQDSANEPR